LLKKISYNIDQQYLSHCFSRLSLNSFLFHCETILRRIHLSKIKSIQSFTSVILFHDPRSTHLFSLYHHSLSPVLAGILLPCGFSLSLLFSFSRTSLYLGPCPSPLILRIYPSLSFARTLRAISFDRARVNLHSHFENRTINGRYRIAVTGVILRRYELISQETIRCRYFSSAPRTLDLKLRLRLRAPSSHAIAASFRILLAELERCVILKIYGCINIYSCSAPFIPTAKIYKTKIDSGNESFQKCFTAVYTLHLIV